MRGEGEEGEGEGGGGGGGEGRGGGGGVQDTFHTVAQQQLPPVVLVACEGGREGGPGIRLYNFPLGAIGARAAGWIGWKFYLAGPRPPLSSPAGRPPTTATLQPQALALSAQQLVTITTCCCLQQFHPIVSDKRAHLRQDGGEGGGGDRQALVNWVCGLL